MRAKRMQYAYNIILFEKILEERTVRLQTRACTYYIRTMYTYIYVIYRIILITIILYIYIRAADAQYNYRNIPAAPPRQYIIYFNHSSTHVYRYMKYFPTINELLGK